MFGEAFGVLIAEVTQSYDELPNANLRQAGALRQLTRARPIIERAPNASQPSLLDRPHTRAHLETRCPLPAEIATMYAPLKCNSSSQGVLK